MSPTLGESQNRTDSVVDRQYVVIASEKQARVVGLPSQTCMYRQQIADTDFVVKAEVISLKGTEMSTICNRRDANSRFSDSVCLVCYVSNGHLLAYSLPSLRPLIDVDFLPLSELRYDMYSTHLRSTLSYKYICTSQLLCSTTACSLITKICLFFSHVCIILYNNLFS